MPRKRLSSASEPAQTAAEVPATFADGLPLPRLFVFDLDYTLWPFWVDTHVSEPVSPVSKDPSTNTAVKDAYGGTYTFYREVPGILHAARQKGITMGLASRTSAPTLAGALLRHIVIPPPLATSQGPDANRVVADEKAPKAWNFFSYKEIYPGSKIAHFKKIHAASKKQESEGEVAYEDMIFFDDESRNREVETKLGVTFVLVPDGVSRNEIDRGVREWRKRRGLSASPNS